jgi:hypothetical protein
MLHEKKGFDITPGKAVALRGDVVSQSGRLLNVKNTIFKKI